MKKFPVIILLLIVFTSRIYSQSYNQQRNQVFFTNVISNGLIGGIGGMINKGKDEKAYHAFIRNFFKGGLGGVVKYTAKYQTYYLGLEDNAPYAPINRLYYFLGHSMVTNASLNRKILETYYCNFYGIDLRINMAAEQKIQARLSLATLCSAVYFGARGFELDFFRSLEYGQWIFWTRPGQIGGTFDGVALFNCIGLQKTNSWHALDVLPHEIIHTYQAYDEFGISSFYNKKATDICKNNKKLTLLSKYLVLDYETLFMSALYIPQYHPEPNYYKNYFEFEAEHFKSRQYIRR